MILDVKQKKLKPQKKKNQKNQNKRIRKCFLGNKEHNK